MATNDLGIAQRLSRGRIKPRRSQSLGTKLTYSEEQELAKAAEAEGKSASEWAREVLLREARGSRTDALFTEMVAMRMMLNNLLRPLSCGETITPDQFTEHMISIRSTKQKVAQDILQQYAAADAKEQR